MAYLESNLGRDEQIISKAEVNILASVPNFIIGGFFVLAALIMSFPMLFDGDSDVVSVAFICLFIGLIIAAIIILPTFLLIKLTELGLTNKKIMGKYGVINTKVMDSPINKINSISVEQGLGGKIFGYAKIVISTSSGGYNFNYIKNADSFRCAVMEQIDLFDEERVRKQAEQLAGAIKQ